MPRDTSSSMASELLATPVSSQRRSAAEKAAAKASRVPLPSSRTTKAASVEDFRTDRPRGGQLVPRTADQDEFVVVEGLRRHVRPLVHTLDEADVELGRLKLPDHGGGVVDEDEEPKPGHAHSQTLQHGRQDGAPYGHAGPDAQGPRILEIEEPPFGLVHEAQSLHGVVSEDLARRRNADPSAQALEKLNAVVTLEFGDALADGGLCHTQALGGGGHAAQLAYGKEYPKMAECHDTGSICDYLSIR